MSTRHTHHRFTLAVVVALVLCPGIARADEVSNWNETLFRTALIGATSPLNTTRVAAIVQAAVFDAINGITRRFTPIHVTALAPSGASADAAVAQAAYATLLALYPAQKPALDARLAVSIADIGTRETGAAIATVRPPIRPGTRAALA